MITEFVPVTMLHGFMQSCANTVSLFLPPSTLILSSSCHSSVTAQLAGMCVFVFGRLPGNLQSAFLKGETSWGPLTYTHSLCRDEIWWDFHHLLPASSHFCYSADLHGVTFSESVTVLLFTRSFMDSYRSLFAMPLFTEKNKLSLYFSFLISGGLKMGSSNNFPSGSFPVVSSTLLGFWLPQHATSPTPPTLPRTTHLWVALWTKNVQMPG